MFAWLRQDAAPLRLGAYLRVEPKAGGQEPDAEPPARPRHIGWQDDCAPWRRNVQRARVRTTRPKPLADTRVALGAQRKSRRPPAGSDGFPVGSDRWDQAAAPAVIRLILASNLASERRLAERIAKPTAPMPRIIIAQVAGSGTAAPIVAVPGPVMLSE